MPNLSVLAGSNAPRFSWADGGTVTEYVVGGTRYRLHSFESAGTFTFTVLRSVGTFRVAYIGAGGGGGGSDGTYAGGGGDGGTGADLSAVSLAVGSYSIVVGAGSTGTGGNTTCFGYTGTGGAGGPDGYYFNRGPGASNGFSSNIKDGSTSLFYGYGGNQGSMPQSIPTTPTPGIGAPGQFGGGGVLGRVGAGPGAVWVRYPIS